jgi:hypothetical protein
VLRAREGKRDELEGVRGCTFPSPSFGLSVFMPSTQKRRRVLVNVTTFDAKAIRDDRLANAKPGYEECKSVKALTRPSRHVRELLPIRLSPPRALLSLGNAGVIRYAAFWVRFPLNRRQVLNEEREDNYRPRITISRCVPPFLAHASGHCPPVHNENICVIYQYTKAYPPKFSLI